jgi:hypothetical protein
MNPVFVGSGFNDVTLAGTVGAFLVKAKQVPADGNFGQRRRVGNTCAKSLCKHVRAIREVFRKAISCSKAIQKEAGLVTPKSWPLQNTGLFTMCSHSAVFKSRHLSCFHRGPERFQSVPELPNLTPDQLPRLPAALRPPPRSRLVHRALQ